MIWSRKRALTVVPQLLSDLVQVRAPDDADLHMLRGTHQRTRLGNYPRQQEQCSRQALTLRSSCKNFSISSVDLCTQRQYREGFKLSTAASPVSCCFAPLATDLARRGERAIHIEQRNRLGCHPSIVFVLALPAPQLKQVRRSETHRWAGHTSLLERTRRAAAGLQEPGIRGRMPQHAETNGLQHWLLKPRGQPAECGPQPQLQLFCIPQARVNSSVPLQT